MVFVLDNSVSMAWCILDEATPFADSILERLNDEEALVPAVWPLEVANVLLLSRRHGRLTDAQVVWGQQVLGELPIQVEGISYEGVMQRVLPMAREHGLSAYDAAYLELAVREGLPLATLDWRLREAARRVGVGLIQEE